MSEYTYVKHTFEPIYDERSRILILGTLPSVKSRENQFYYGHPQNRFWKVIAEISGEAVPITNEEKKAIYANGGKAYELYRKYALEQTGREIIKLPSTSPANAGYGLERLCDEWKQRINI